LRQNGAVAAQDAIDDLLAPKENDVGWRRAQSAPWRSGVTHPERTRSALSSGSVNQECPPTRLPFRIREFAAPPLESLWRGRRHPPRRPGTESRSLWWITPPQPPECHPGRVAQLCDQLRTSVLASGQRGDTDYMHVVFDRMAATSRGVWNRGPISTSKPISANAVAITFEPRSWPSCPIFATRIRDGRLRLVQTP